MNRNAELHIQSHLRAGGTLAALDEVYGIRSRRHVAHPNLVTLKYNQIASPWEVPLVRECRGIVLDEANGWRVVSRAFDKFFNHGETHAAPINWSTARVQEKLDGSLCVLYWFADDWHVATTGTPDGTGEVHHSADVASFAEYFWATFNAQGGKLPAPGDLCFAFELMGPENRVVVPHTERRVALLAVRDRVTGEQFLPDDFATAMGVPAVRSFELGSWSELADSFAGMNPLQQEGYVVVDGSFNRVKVKHPGYVQLHHAKDSMSDRALVDIVRKGEAPEVIAVFPEFAARMGVIRDAYESFLDEVERDFAELRDEPTQKDFALKAVKRRCSSALFAARKGEAVREHALRQQPDKLLEWLGVAT